MRSEPQQRIGAVGADSRWRCGPWLRHRPRVEQGILEGQRLVDFFLIGTLGLHPEAKPFENLTAPLPLRMQDEKGYDSPPASGRGRQQEPKCKKQDGVPSIQDGGEGDVQWSKESQGKEEENGSGQGQCGKTLKAQPA
ncbi:hypothetical protein P175DRAFT_0530811 [Aspergillus ochraceoroseus IBT 24754]|uniref:Uncharacterized protein n=1 Tax=Aspergillus ochraceoroseus IBT 24754 TaxID=1392256 RepID=A0A2T5LYG3_9EURO|nr:uncharacterized protein P175DRAFT_0530811 [Aspergillus ochraceoroseus IBT 24754]PTU21319.1 hypothetical protein P175DRAFT_0530811 [Aspergillus ochraceoroseus IBT 24754]